MHQRSRYDQDFYRWTQETAQQLRTGHWDQIDVESVAEELESMGKSSKRELLSRLAVLMAHLLKWQFQKVRRSNSWKATIKEQRFEIVDLLEDSPSLKKESAIRLPQAYRRAVVMAANEIGVDEALFPKDCPFTIDNCLDQNFFPN